MYVCLNYVTIAKRYIMFGDSVTNVYESHKDWLAHAHIRGYLLKGTSGPRK